MNKAYYQSMFGSTTGNVYRYIGETDSNENPTSAITEQFIVAAETSLMSIVVVNTLNMYLVYSDLSTIVESLDFEHITNLIPDPVIEIAVTEPEVTPPEEV